MIDPVQNLRDFLKSAPHQKKRCNFCNSVTCNEIKDLDGIFRCNRAVTAVTEVPFLAVKVTEVTAGDPDPVTEKVKQNQILNSEVTALQRLHGFFDRGGSCQPGGPDAGACPIPIEEIVRALKGKEDDLIREFCLTPQAAKDRAISIVRGLLLNHPALAPTQWDVWRCFVCNERDLPNNPIAPFLTPIPDRHAWLHLDCHDQFCRDRGAAVDGLIEQALEAQRSASQQEWVA